MTSHSSPANLGSEHLTRARRVFEIELAEAQRVAARLDECFVSAVEAIRECIEKRGKVIVLGVGKSGHIGEKIAATLTSTGCPAVVLNSLNALHGDLGMVADGDVILALSASGETEELLNVLPALRRFDVRIVAMTGGQRSTLAQHSDVVLDVSVEQEACPLNLAPTSSTTAMLVLGDALAMVLLEARGFTKEDFARYHPGGQLGRALLIKVRDIMRGGDQMALVRPAHTVREVLATMSRCRAGLGIAVDEQGCLAGIFAHSDFARHFQKYADIGDRPVDEFLTRKPITVREDRLAVEVLHLIEEYRVDDIVVVDEANRPLGVVDSQDLARLRLV